MVLREARKRVRREEEGRTRNSSAVEDGFGHVEEARTTGAYIGGLAAILQGRTRPCKVAKISNFYKPCEGACIVLDMQVGTSNLPQGQVRFHKACVLPQESDGG